MKDGHKVLLGLGLAGALLAAVWRLPVKDYLVSFQGHLDTLGAPGLAVISLVYVAACLLFIPGAALTLGAGFLAATVWPNRLLPALFWGTVAVSAGSTAGATAAFLAGRYLGRGWVARRVAENPRFHAVDAAIGQHGLRMVLLLRLSPVFPFNLLNYGLGATRVSLRDYVVASWLGMLPATVFYVYVGIVTGGLADASSRGAAQGPGRWVVMGMGLAASLALVLMVGRMARKALDGTLAKRTWPDSSP